MQPVEVRDADPVFDEHMVVRSVEPDIGGLIIRIVKSRDRRGPVGKPCDDVG